MEVQNDNKLTVRPQVGQTKQVLEQTGKEYGVEEETPASKKVAFSNVWLMGVGNVVRQDDVRWWCTACILKSRREECD